jgi:hypothetical protein
VFDRPYKFEVLMAAKMAALQRRLSNAGLASKDAQLIAGAEEAGEVAGICVAS